MHHQRLLIDAYQDKRRKNPGFSLRAFSRQLRISPAQLSQLISGKRPLTAKVAFKMAEALGLSPTERGDLLARVHSAAAPGGKGPGPEVTLIAEDQFKLISEWHHFAILSLGDLKTNRADPRWIARRLNIDPIVAREAWARLVRMKLVELRPGGGGYRQATGPLRTAQDVPSEAVRSYHKQYLELAARRIDELGVEERHYTSLTIAGDPARMRKAKALIERFKEELGQLIEKGERTRVYTLAVQLFPVCEPATETQSTRRN